MSDNLGEVAHQNPTAEGFDKKRLFATAEGSRTRIGIQDNQSVSQHWVEFLGFLI